MLLHKEGLDQSVQARAKSAASTRRRIGSARFTIVMQVSFKLLLKAIFFLLQRGTALQR